MANTTTFDLLARDRASGPINKVGDAFDKTSGKARGLNGAFGAITAGSRGLHTSFGLIGRGAALAAGAAGLGGLIAGFKGIYEEGRQSQKVAAQTAAVIKSTGGVAQISASHVAALSQAISNKAGVDDEAIQSGANLLLTFSGIRNEAGKGNQVFDEAARVVTDMTAAMNAGKVTQEGLRTTSIAVGKALQNPIRGTTALRKVGVALTDQQVKQIKVLVEHGHKLEAQKIILGELNKEFGGSAAAGTNAMQKLGVVFDNIKEQVGTALLPVIDKVASWMSSTLPSAVSVAGRVVGPVLHALGVGFGALIASFKDPDVTSSGWVGVMERIGAAARTAVDFIRGTVIPGFQALGDVFSGMFGGDSVRKVETATGRLETAKTRLSELQTQAAKGIGGTVTSKQTLVQAEDGTWVPLSFYGGKAPKGSITKTVTRTRQASKTEFAKQIDDARQEVEQAGKDLVTAEGKATQSFGKKLGERIGAIGQALIATVKEWGGGIARGIAEWGREFWPKAKAWGGELIAGFKTGLDTGDWSGLGETVGKGIIAAIGAAGNLAKQIAGKLGELFGKVDWVGLGITVGKQAVPFVLGLVTGILTFDLWGALKGLAAHWQDVLLAVIAVAFTPARILGKVGELLARIPLVGRLLAWGLEHFSAFSKGLVRMVGNALSFLGRAFLDGFRSIFPGIGASFARWLGLLPTRLGVIALDVAAAARRMMVGLGRAIASMAGWVVRNIGQFIGQMLKPWADAGTWLVRAGLGIIRGLGRGLLAAWRAVWTWIGGLAGAIRGAFNLAGNWLIDAGRRVLRGLWTGITAAWRGIASWFGGMGSRVGGWFAAAGSWLWSAGRNMIGGIWSGIKNAMGGVGRILGDVKDKIVGGLKRLFGINSPSTVMAGIGGHIITGLIKGLLTQSGALARTVKGIGGTVANIFPDLAGAGRSLGGYTGTGPPVPYGLGSVQALVKALASANYGWTGQQWTALYNLIMGESGFNPNAQNPTSSAYGIFQFLNSTWAGVGARKTSDPYGQTLAGLRYISQVYGNPSRAYGAWLSRSPHWYGAGMAPTVFSTPTVIGVGERGPETVTIVPHSSGRGRESVTSLTPGVGGLTEEQMQRAFVAALRSVGMTGGSVGREIGLTMTKFGSGGRR